MGYIAELQQIDTADEPTTAPYRAPATPWLGATARPAPVDWPASADASGRAAPPDAGHPDRRPQPHRPGTVPAPRVPPVAWSSAEEARSARWDPAGTEPAVWSAPVDDAGSGWDPEPTDVYAALGTLAAGPVDADRHRASSPGSPDAALRAGPARHLAQAGGLHPIDITPGAAPPAAARSPRRRRRLAVLAGAAAAVLAGGVGYAVLRPSDGPDLRVAPVASAPALLFDGDAAPGAEAVPGAEPVATASVTPSTSTPRATRTTIRADSPPAPGTVPATDPVTGRPGPAAPSVTTRPAPAPSSVAPPAEAPRLTATLSGSGEPDGDGIAGYSGTVRVANPGERPAGAWRVALTVPGGNQVRADPTVAVSQDGEAVTFTPADGTIPAGAAVSFTFTVDGVLSAPPHGCLLDGAPCG